MILYYSYQRHQTEILPEHRAEVAPPTPAPLHGGP